MKERITQLETKVAFQERLLQDLNAVLIEQQMRIDLLERRMKELKEQGVREDLVKGLDEEGPPPHY